jgi:hypothetical protein
MEMGTEGKGNQLVASYRIVLQGRVPARWFDWLDGVRVIWEDDGGSVLTHLECSTIDQAALHGVLAKIRDLNLILLRVEQG